MSADNENQEELFDVLDVSNVPTPVEVQSTTVEDKFKSEPAFKFCFLGSGQGGSRLAYQFWKMGYRRVAAVNTALQDSDPLQLPDDNKKVFGQGGAGGNPELGAKMVEDNQEDIYNLVRRCFGEEFDRIMVTVTAGGGTGAGSAVGLIAVCKDYINRLGKQDDSDPQVGVIVALPKESDGAKAHKNALYTLDKLVKMAKKGEISPLVIIDNQRVERLYPQVAVNAFWDTANNSICSIFHLINVVANHKSPYTSFDRKDLETLLRSGLLTFGATPVTSWGSPDDISVAIRDNLKNNVLVGGVDLSTGTVAGCIVVGNKDVLDNVPNSYLDEGFSMLGRMIQPGSAVQRGIYVGNNKGMVVYTMIGGLEPPKVRLENLKRAGGVRDFDGA